MILLSNTIASESAGGGNVLQTLGIDVKLLVFQVIAFLILVWLLGRFIFPVLIRTIDERQRRIDEGLKEAIEARKALEEASAKADELLVKARKQADDILAATNKEVGSIILEAEEKAARRSKSIVEEAKVEIESQVQKVRHDLKKEARQLVADATARIIGEKLDVTKNAKLVDDAISGSKEQV